MNAISGSTFVCIDLKSFFASVECVARGLNPLTTKLVVADESRTEKTICLAVTPALKSYGVSGRARLFEVKQRVEEINRSATEKVEFLIAPPQMQRYLDVSAQIYSIYLRYVAPEDIHVYSIDEVFIDVTAYLDSYHLSAHELARTMIRDVLEETGITATAGIGPNLYLAKIAMDITAKKMPADEDGVRIAALTERTYREKLWSHEPLTDFWMVGHGIAERLARLGLTTMGDIARFSLENEEHLFQVFGVDAEILIDHAWGIEPTQMHHIKNYKTSTESMGVGQVLKCPYDFEKTRIVIREMTEEVIGRLIDHEMVTEAIVLHVGYDSSNQGYLGESKLDHYGKRVPVSAHGTANLGGATESPGKILDAVMTLYDRIVDRNLTTRRMNVTAIRLSNRSDIAYQTDLFDDNGDDTRETDLVRATQKIRHRFGKNAIFKAYDLLDGATQLERNGQIGGHKA